VSRVKIVVVVVCYSADLLMQLVARQDSNCVGLYEGHRSSFISVNYQASDYRILFIQVILLYVFRFYICAVVRRPVGLGDLHSRGVRNIQVSFSSSTHIALQIDKRVLLPIASFYGHGRRPSRPPIFVYLCTCRTINVHLVARQ
jgi:hypothetical protein